MGRPAPIKSLRELCQFHRPVMLPCSAAVPPQYRAGTVYDAELSTHRVRPRHSCDAAPAGTAPAPDSILIVRPATTLDRQDAARHALRSSGDQTVFSADRVILPEAPGRSFGHAGDAGALVPSQRPARFLFERQVPTGAGAAGAPTPSTRATAIILPSTMKAGAMRTPRRFIAPLLTPSLHGGSRTVGFADPDGDGSTAGWGVGVAASAVHRWD